MCHINKQTNTQSSLSRHALLTTVQPYTQCPDVQVLCVCQVPLSTQIHANQMQHTRILFPCLSVGRVSRRLEDEPRRGRAVHLRPSSAAVPRQDLSVSVLQLLDLTLQILDLPGEPRPFRHRLGRDGRTRCLGVDRCEPSSPRHAPTVAPQPLMETGTARALFWGAQSSPTRSGGPWHFGQAAPPPHPGRTPPPV